jgi:hypothetical protein
MTEMNKIFFLSYFVQNGRVSEFVFRGSREEILLSINRTPSHSLGVNKPESVMNETKSLRALNPGRTSKDREERES